MFEGLMRESMRRIVEALNTDATMIENKARVYYRLDHPSKQISQPNATFQLFVEPSGWSQLAGAGALDLQYFFWIFVKCKPSGFGVNEEERLSKILEYVSTLLHGKKWGELNTYLSRAMINYRTVVIKTNNRDIHFELGKDEIGATLMFWQSRKNAEELEAEEVGGEV